MELAIHRLRLQMSCQKSRFDPEKLNFSLILVIFSIVIGPRSQRDDKLPGVNFTNVLCIAFALVDP